MRSSTVRWCHWAGWLVVPGRVARDFVGRRKPVLIGGAVAMLFVRSGITFSTGQEAAAIGCFIFGIASGRRYDSVHHRQGSESGRGQRGARQGESTSLLSG